MSATLKSLIALERAATAARRSAEAELAAAGLAHRIAQARLAELDADWRAQPSLGEGVDAAALARWTTAQDAAREDGANALLAASDSLKKAEARARLAIARAEAAAELVATATVEHARVEERRFEAPPNRPTDLFR